MVKETARGQQGERRGEQRGEQRGRGMVRVFFFSGNLLGGENDVLFAKIKNDISIKDITVGAMQKTIPTSRFYGTEERSENTTQVDFKETASTIAIEESTEDR